MMSANCIEGVFHDINRFTTMNQNSEKNRESAANCETVRNYIFRKMRENDKMFAYLTRGHCLAGSVADKIKIIEPDEFDILLPMKLPYHESIKVTTDNSIPGYVKINLKDCLTKMAATPTLDEAYKSLKKMVDKKSFLLPLKVQGWVQKILTNIKLQGTQFECDGRHFSLSYTTSGPAHTVHVKTIPNNFSIDLVPALPFSKKQWCALRPCPSNFNEYWHAVPKPVRNAKGEIIKENTSWQGAYSLVEKQLINKKNNLKNALRILKKLKERQSYGTFKSYFVKTMFLLEYDKVDEFWNQPLWKLVFYMTEKWIEYLKAGKLPFYWDKRCNLLAKANYTTMAYQLEAVYAKMQKYQTIDRDQILLLFLTNDEFSILRAPKTAATQTALESSKTVATQTALESSKTVATQTALESHKTVATQTGSQAALKSPADTDSTFWWCIKRIGGLFGSLNDASNAS